MITLYAADTANSSKILIALEELELPYVAVPVDILAGEQFGDDLTSLNPNSKIPVIVDTDGFDGTRHIAFESGAILLYLAERYGRLLPERPGARNEAIQWLMVQISTVGPMMGQLIHFSVFAPTGNDYALDRYRSQVHRVFDVLDNRLGGREWIGGDDYGVVDIAHFPWIRPMKLFLGKDADSTYPRLAEWVDRIADRPAVIRADEAKANLAKHLTKPEAVDPDKVDLLMSRGPHSRGTT